MKAFAKLNLRLHVINKREDNYHNLQMVNVRINLHDKIKIYTKKVVKDEVIYINNPNINYGDEDLILKVLKAFKKEYNINSNFKIKIEKHIPIGSGLGGSSMDVGMVLNYIIKKFKLNVSTTKLIEFVKPFGADIPYSLYMCPCIVEGIGEIITKIELKPKKFIIVYPNISVSTKQIFKDCKIETPMLEQKIMRDEVNRGIYKNDLEKTTIELYPALKELKMRLSDYGQVFMTGSGSCFVLLPNKQIKRTFKEIKRYYPEYKVEIIKTKKGN